jgi:hypothetical protein
MSRSRSSFDLAGAIATAASLSVVVPEEKPTAQYRGIPLVSFGPSATGPATIAPPPPAPEDFESDSTRALRSVRPSSRRASATIAAELPPEPSAAVAAVPSAEPTPVEDAHGPIDTARRPPKLPDLSDIRSPVVRCEKIIDWIMEAVGVSEVFIADAAGLPVAGVAEPEARLAAAGVVGASVAHLVAAIPGSGSALFELHVGEGPFFQLIGFEVGSSSYVVGFHRPTPLGFRQAHAVRLACRHALGVTTEPPGGDA